MSASGNRLLEPLALHTGRLLQALQRLVLAVASGREPLVSPRVDGWALVAERASTALVELTVASFEQAESELSASLSHGVAPWECVLRGVGVVGAWLAHG